MAILGSLLFLMCINDLSVGIHFKVADDITLCSSVTDIYESTEPPSKDEYVGMSVLNKFLPTFYYTFPV